MSSTTDPERTGTVRLLRYRESVAQTDPRTLIDAEFRDQRGDADLRLSVYVASLRRLVQLALEHHASAGLSPPLPRS